MADISATNWNPVDANNTTTPPDGWPSVTMLPNQVEPSARAIMGALRRLWERSNGTVTTSGSSGAYVYASANTSYPTAYVQGDTYVAKLDKKSAGNDTFQVNALAALSIYKATAFGVVKIAALDLLAGDMVSFIYDSSLNSGAGGFVVRPLLGGFVPWNQSAGLTLSNDSGTPNTKVDVAAGQATDSTNTVVMTLSSSKVIDFTTNGALGLDTGSITLSQWYAILLIAGTSGTSVMATVLSSSGVSPTMPAGYSYYRYIGAVKTDGSGHIIAFTQVGNAFYWGTAVTDSNSTIGTVLGSSVTLSVPPGYPMTPLLRIGGYTGTGYVIVTSPVEGNPAPSNSAAPWYDVSLSGVVVNSWLQTDTHARIWYRANIVGGAFVIVTRGWIDPHVGAVY